jgi:hypothetical protein
MVIREQLEALLPSDRLIADVRALLREGSNRIELDVESVVVAPDVSLKIVARSAHTGELATGLGDHLQAVVVAGKVSIAPDGWFDGADWYVKLYYRLNGDLITADFLRTLD